MHLPLLARAVLFLLFPLIPWLTPGQPPVTRVAYQPYVYKNEVAVLMYHHISNTAASSSTITPRLFAEHLDALQKYGYHVIPATEMTAFLSGRAAVPPQAVVITFDDGYESFYRYAYPALLAHHMTATCFVIVGSVGEGENKQTRMNWKQVPKLTWAQMREMQAHGMSFYPHSYAQHYLARFSPAGARLRPALFGPIWLAGEHRMETEAEYKKRVYTDLLLSKQVMERELHHPVDQFCWPYGKAGPTALQIGESLGYKNFYFIDKGLNDPLTGPLHIKRINAGSPNITPEVLLHNLNYYARLSAARQKITILSRPQPPQTIHQADAI